ncbi:SDR family oxidoreductase [Piscinibacter sakaiensis]|uniref:SDR family oxidoreductase n=1 Tax=Piscinibacter sakaiensis TaxID=1547922 RepID=UPI00372783FC
MGVNYAHDAAAAQALVDELQGLGVQALALQADVADEAQVLAMFARVDAELPPLWGLVNNAGIVGPAIRVEALDLARLQRIFAVNVAGSFLCAREALRRLSTRHGGHGGSIVNLSSVASTLGSAGIYVDYAASKGAIDTFTVGLAREVAAEGVRVNAVRPGIIDTEIHAGAGMTDRLQQAAAGIPIGRVGRADEIALGITWLLDPENTYTTGAILDIAGGR